jgi:hypothetical protein
LEKLFVTDVGLRPPDEVLLPYPDSAVLKGSLNSITDEHVILSKLFRRLAEYLQAGGSVAGFKEFLEAKEEEIIVISTVHPTHFDTVVEVEGNTVRLTETPENLIFEG